MKRNHTILLIAAGLIATVAGCSSDSGTADTKPNVSSSVTSAGDSSSTSVQSTTTTAPTITVATTSANTEVPVTATVATDGTTTTTTAANGVVDDDWVSIIQSLVNIRDELYATSDPTRAGEVCADTAFCYGQLVAQLTDAQSKGWHVADQGPLTIVSAVVENTTKQDGIELAVVRTEYDQSPDFGRVVDTNGNTVYELVSDDPNRPLQGEIRWTLVRLEAGWRLVDQEAA